MEKVFLDEFTWPEIYEYLKKNDLVYVPVGTLEGHGPHLPMGTDTYIATAVSVLAANKSKGIVLPPIPYSFTGATIAFKGTITIPITIQSIFLQEIIKALWSQGFKRIILVSIHGPNDIILSTVVREVFESWSIPAVYFNPYKVIKDKVPKDYDIARLEASLVFASLKVLKKDYLIPDLSKLKDIEPPPLNPYFLKIQERGGVVGFRYTDILQHLPPRSNIDIDFGIKLLNYAADELVKLSKDLKKYIKSLEDH